jgi:hypothetical protein
MLQPMLLRRCCLRTVLPQELMAHSCLLHQAFQLLWRLRLPSQQQHQRRWLLRSSRNISSPCNQACLLFHPPQQPLRGQPLMLRQGKQRFVGRMMGPHASGAAWALVRALRA